MKKLIYTLSLFFLFTACKNETSKRNTPETEKEYQEDDIDNTRNNYGIDDSAEDHHGSEHMQDSI